MALNQLEKLGLKAFVEAKITEVSQEIEQLAQKMQAIKDTPGETEEYNRLANGVLELQGFINGAKFVGDAVLAELKQG